MRRRTVGDKLPPLSWGDRSSERQQKKGGILARQRREKEGLSVGIFNCRTRPGALQVLKREILREIGYRLGYLGNPTLPGPRKYRYTFGELAHVFVVFSHIGTFHARAS